MKRKDKANPVLRILAESVLRSRLLAAALVLVIAGSIAAALLPPLVLERIIDGLSSETMVSACMAVLYVALLILSGILSSVREVLLVVFGQRITHALRQEMCGKLSRLSAESLTAQEPGAAVSRFIGDVDTVESLFTSGVISMFADICQLIGIFAVILRINPGLAGLLLLLLPPLFFFTRHVQKRMLRAQLDNRAAVARVTGHVPETIRCIRMIHTLHREAWFQKCYLDDLNDSFAAVEQNNFYDAVYSPVILILNAAVIAAAMLLAASGNAAVLSIFGMSVGTSVAVISYIAQVFTPIESIGMEIQTIQSAVAGVKRIHSFLMQPERWEADETPAAPSNGTPCVELSHVNFGYGEEADVLGDLSFTVKKGESVTLTGRTGAGKSTVFKLILGLYRPRQGHVLVNGTEASQLSDAYRRRLFGCVEQNFRMVPGSVLEQITLFDDGITRRQAEQAARTAGLHEEILSLKNGYDTPCTPDLFSQGQWQLLSIARAVAAEPQILLLDEITANLDADTELKVLKALRRAGENRTVLSISHRLYRQMGGREVIIH